MVKDATHRYTFCTIPSSTDTARAKLANPIQDWCNLRYDDLTLAQRHALEAIANGENLLLASPTGSGKTLAAFLPIISAICQEPAYHSTRCLYVSPLKALCNDMERQISACATELQQCQSARAPTVLMRTGDTTSSARNKLFTSPPDILITTPESLALLLAHCDADNLFGSLRWVVVDEVHALAGSKRGADLSLSLERLEQRATVPLQRIGLSATCAPLEDAGEYLCGPQRSCTIAAVHDDSEMQITIEPLDVAGDGALHGQRFFRRLLERIDLEIETHRTILIFCNKRRLAERLTWRLRQRHPEWTDRIGVHHSSLDKKRRQHVEQKLKQGELSIVVSSSSLELGIDIGGVDLVVLVHPPGGVTRLLQRVGRSGHGPGRIRRGLIFTQSTGDLLETVVTLSSCATGQLEMLQMQRHPLDVLCQQLLGMAAHQSLKPIDVFALIRRAAPYQDLTWTDFRSCLDYLSGRDISGRQWLPARLRWHNGRFSLRDAQTLQILRQNIGTILSDDATTVQLDDGVQIGELDFAFAERLLPGDRFVLEGRCLQVQQTDAGTLIVTEIAGRPLLPRWSGESRSLVRGLAERLFVFRCLAGEALLHSRQKLLQLLQEDFGLLAEAANILADFFEEQETISQIPLPGQCLIEVVHSDQETSYFVHSPLSRAGNDAVARVVSHRLQRMNLKYDVALVADLGFLICTDSARDLAPAEWRALLRLDNFSDHLEEAVADSTLMRDRFQRIAFTGLLLLKNPIGGWQQRDRRQRRLFDEVRARDDDFVLLRQARRELMEECLDIDSAATWLERLQTSEIHLRWLPCISPFAEAWTQPYSPGPPAVNNHVPDQQPLPALVPPATSADCA